MVRIGLNYGSSTLTAANLQNNTGYGEGYRFGYYDEDLEFIEIGYTETDQTKLTILPTSQMYYTGSEYVKECPDKSYDSIGCYHVVLGCYDSFEEALEAGEDYRGSFVAWIKGVYQLRQGAYETKEEAEAAMEELEGEEVKGTSSYAVNVVETGKSRILFQFDGGKDTPMGIMPDVTGEDDVRTWFKGYKYRGGFRYERIDGQDLTVVNIIDLETYIQGVIPYEMSNNWPLEALKAQAVCARSYAYNNLEENKHSAVYHFDLCNTVDCQVYRGVGSDNTRYQANELTDRAVLETAGEYGLYDGEPIWAFYSSSHGGASERIDNVWDRSLSKFPYICGVIDPYEKKTAHLNSYSYWMKVWTREELTQRLRERGYAANTTVEELELTYSERGNAIKVKVIYKNGKENTFTPKMSWGLLSLFGISSLHFTINGQGTGEQVEVPSEEITQTPVSGAVMVNSNEELDTDQRLYVLSGKSKNRRLELKDACFITGDGDVITLEDVMDDEESSEGTSGNAAPDTPTNTVVRITGNRFVLEGAGNGHQLGMSQFGAYAMAEEGFTYEDIVEFYYPGTQVDTL